MSNQIFAGGWTIEKLTALTVQKRHNVWKNARTRSEPDAIELVHVIEELGLPYSDSAALTMDDPVTIKMWEIINSDIGKAACIKATADGLPAIAGVDSLLNDALGIDYRGENMATVTAGSLVGELMRSLGYVRGNQRPLPSGSIAKTGAFWEKRK